MIIGNRLPLGEARTYLWKVVKSRKIAELK